MAHITPVGKYILQNVDQLTPLDMAHHTPMGNHILFENVIQRNK